MFASFLFFWKREKSWIIEWIQKIIILITIWMFMLLTGGGAPIYRAVASAYCGMILFQEKTSQVYALTVTILILTILSPFQTLYDPSFHLTCCATFGLILFSKPIDTWIRLSYLRFIPNWLREIMSVTLATQVFVFPYIMFMTSSFSSVFLLSNVLVLPIIPIIMLFGFITLCADLLHVEFLVDLSVYVNNIFLHIVFYVVKILAEVPYGYMVVTKTTSIGILVVYGFVFGILIFKFLDRRKSPLNNIPV
jgi:competence protein ComEC